MNLRNSCGGLSWWVIVGVVLPLILLIEATIIRSERKRRTSQRVVKPDNIPRQVFWLKTAMIVLLTFIFYYWLYLLF